MFDTILHEALIAVVIFLIGALGKLLVDPSTVDAVKALGTKLAAETEHAVALTDVSNNTLLQAGVHAAMVYAENHEDEALKLGDSKAEYVIATIQKDPRFAHLNLPLEALKQLIEQLYSAYFAGLKSPTPATKAPADNVGGPGGKTTEVATPVL